MSFKYLILLTFSFSFTFSMEHNNAIKNMLNNFKIAKSEQHDKEPLDHDISKLIKAAKKGENEEVFRLIVSGIDINSINKKGKTALMKAAKKGNLALVQFLLKNGAHTYMQDCFGKTAVMHALDYNQHRLDKKLYVKRRGYRKIPAIQEFKEDLILWKKRQEVAYIIINKNLGVIDFISGQNQSCSFSNQDYDLHQIFNELSTYYNQFEILAMFGYEWDCNENVLKRSF